MSHKGVTLSWKHDERKPLGVGAALFPTSTYHHNSGGDPVDIPDLTHAQLQGFHALHYHPSNARFFTYGDLPLEATLQASQDQAGVVLKTSTPPPLYVFLLLKFSSSSSAAARLYDHAPCR